MCRCLGLTDIRRAACYSLLLRGGQRVVGLDPLLLPQYPPLSLSPTHIPPNPRFVVVLTCVVCVLGVSCVCVCRVPA
jgi:hypothetical protein